MQLLDYLETAIDRMEDAILIGESKETETLKSWKLRMTVSTKGS